MLNSLLFTSGFFFYHTVVRQDLFAKLAVTTYNHPTQLPEIVQLELTFLQHREATLPSGLGAFGAFMVANAVTASGALKQKVKKYQNTTEFMPLPFLSLVITQGVNIYAFFLLLFFVLFQGYHRTTELVSITKGVVPLLQWGVWDKEDRAVTEYLKHKVLRVSFTETLSAAKATFAFPTTEFMTNVPEDCGKHSGMFYLTVWFNTNKRWVNRALLSALRLHQRVTTQTFHLLCVT